MIKKLFKNIFLLLFFLIFLLQSLYSYDATAIIKDTYVENQAKNIKIGVNIPEGSSRYSMNIYNNFFGNYDFEDNDSWTQYPKDDKWDRQVDGLTYNYVTNYKVDGKQSLKVTVSKDNAIGSGIGQWASGKKYLSNTTYNFTCFLKQEGMDETVENTQFQIYFSDTGNNCRNGYYKSQNFTVKNEWNSYTMQFSPTNDCLPKDPSKGGANSKRINVLSKGSLWIDHCEIIDTSRYTDWGINKRYIDLLMDFSPGTIRYGGLGANWIEFEELTGSNFGREKNLMTMNDFLLLAQLSNADPTYVISSRFEDEEYNYFMEYLFANNDTDYGLQRHNDGYDSWKDVFENFYFELGNELLCAPSPGRCFWGSENYADWSTHRINIFKNNDLWNDNMLIGFNFWGHANTWNIPVLELESNNINGGNADFLLSGRYYTGSKAFSYENNGQKTDYSYSQIRNNPDLFYKFVLGQSYLNKEFANMWKEIGDEFYPKRLKIGIYEYGPSGFKKDKPKEVWDMEKSIGYGLSVLDMSVMAKQTGMESINYFNFHGSLDDASWQMVDMYPNEIKRPVFYLLSMHNKYSKGKFLEYEFLEHIKTFDPYGPGAGNIEALGCDRGVNGCSNTNWDLEKRNYPTSVSSLEIYPFKDEKNNRYSFLIINRDLYENANLTLNLPYEPSKDAQLFYVTANSPTATNENGDEIVIMHQELDDFHNNYELNIRPFSAYLLVNYESGSTVCIDEDGDGYGSNPYDNKDCRYEKVDCVDNNENIHPDNQNSFCDCNYDDKYYIGGYERNDDNIDNDCDGRVDESASPLKYYFDMSNNNDEENDNNVNNDDNNEDQNQNITDPQVENPSEPQINETNQDQNETVVNNNDNDINQTKDEITIDIEDKEPQTYDKEKNTDYLNINSISIDNNKTSFGETIKIKAYGIINYEISCLYKKLKICSGFNSCEIFIDDKFLEGKNTITCIITKGDKKSQNLSSSFNVEKSMNLDNNDKENLSGNNNNQKEMTPEINTIENNQIIENKEKQSIPYTFIIISLLISITVSYFGYKLYQISTKKDKEFEEEIKKHFEKGYSEDEIKNTLISKGKDINLYDKYKNRFEKK